MHRHYRVIGYDKGNARYLQLVVQYPNPPGVWRTNTVRSYGRVTPEGEAQAQRDLNELKAYASHPKAPVPTGMADDAVWRNFQKYSQSGPPSPLDPVGIAEALRGAVSDLAHLAGWVISDAVGNVAAKVDITQPDMNETEKQQFIEWLNDFPPDVQRRLLAYKWRFP